MASYGLARTNLSRASLSKMARSLQAARSAAMRSREKVTEVVDTAVTTAAMGATGFALGAVRGAYGPLDIMGVPVELAGALGAHALAMFLGDDAAKHLRAAGNAAAAVWAYNLGTETVGGAAGGATEESTEGQGLPERDLRDIT